MKIYYDKDADLARLEGRTVAILGYGSQGHAHTLNLRDSGVDVVVGLRRDGASWAKAEAESLRVLTVSEAVAAADVVMMTLPDEDMGDIKLFLCNRFGNWPDVPGIALSLMDEVEIPGFAALIDGHI